MSSNEQNEKTVWKVSKETPNKAKNAEKKGSKGWAKAAAAAATTLCDPVNAEPDTNQ